MTGEAIRARDEAAETTPGAACDGGAEALLAAAWRARERARALDRPVAACVTVPDPEAPDPIALFAAADEGERFLWESAAGCIVASGAAFALEGAGRDRLAAVARELEALRRDAPGLDARGLPVARDGAELAGPLLLGGFAFGDEASGEAWRGFPQARFVLPALQWSGAGAARFRTSVLRIAPGDEPEAAVRAHRATLEALLRRAAAGASAAEPAGELAASYRAQADRPAARYRRTVARALEDIHAGRLEKVVVARSCTLVRPGGFAPARVLAALRASQPGCTRFAVGRAGATFLAATPERLLRRRGRHVTTAALAGSAPRGRTPEEDAALAAALCESKKEQEEHAYVVRALREALAPHCDAVEAGEAPAVLRLEGIQHLHTPVSARLRGSPPPSLLALACALHPSPAVAGTPRAAAIAWLRAHEALDRGWYTGGVGWTTPDGDGELSVALRSVLLRGDEARLHAGAGIVRGSTPEAELAETRLKLRAGLSALLEL